MSMKYVTAGALIGTALMSSVAFAQTAAPAANSAMTSAPMAATSHQGQWRTSKLIGLNVYNNSNEKLGDINELLIDNSGKVHAVILGVGGFLGMGEHDVSVNFDQLKFVNEPVVANATTATPRPAGSAMTPTASTTTTGSATTPATTTASSSTTTKSDWYPDHAMLNATKDQLKAMTEFKY